MDYLARREYGHAELVTKLTTAGFDADIASRIVAQLTDEGLQSNSRFAESFVQSRINLGKGPVRIREELRQRGFRSAEADAAIDACSREAFGAVINAQESPRIG